MKNIRAIAAILFMLMGGHTAFAGLGMMLAGERKMGTLIYFIVGLAIVLAAIDFWRGNERARKVLLTFTWVWLVLNVIDATLLAYGLVSQVGFNNLGSFIQTMGIALVMYGIPAALALWLLKKSASQPRV